MNKTKKIIYNNFDKLLQKMIRLRVTSKQLAQLVSLSAAISYSVFDIRRDT